MSRWERGYTEKTPKQVFKFTYIICATINLFGLVNLWRTHFYSAEYTKMKWLGGILGVLENAAALALIYVFCNVAEILVLGIIVAVAHVAHLFLLGFLWKPDKDI